MGKSSGGRWSWRQAHGPRVLGSVAWLSVAAATLLPSVAQGYCLTHTTTLASCGACIEGGLQVRWERNDVEVVLSESAARETGLAEPDLRRVLSESLQTWREVRCPTADGSLQPVALELRTSPGASDVQVAEGELCPAAVNVVSFLSAEAWEAQAQRQRAAKEVVQYESDRLALTTHWFDQQTGVLLGADIEFNAGSFDFVICPESGCEGGSRERDLGNTLVHELGHVLGLSHSDDSEATMSCQEERDGETGKRDLTPDDEAGLCALFPPSGYAQRQAEGAQADAELQRICEPVAPQSCAVKPWHLGSPSSAPGGWLGALLALSAVGLLGRRRRRDCRGTRAAWARLG